MTCFPLQGNAVGGYNCGMFCLLLLPSKFAEENRFSVSTTMAGKWPKYGDLQHWTGKGIKANIININI